ncbi:MAG TPA: DUF6537 domain-containing protein, partial [Burkholderiales bacterium]
MTEVLAWRLPELIAYQDLKYAQRYIEVVQRARAAETSTSDSRSEFSRAVARNLFHLMAYKDEYEVARLYTDTAFMAKINAQFEGDFKVNFHLAPPLFAKRNANGELVKKRYGPWMMSAFGLLAKMKGLRGGALDIFGYTEERRKERAMIGEYRDTLRGLIGELSAANLEQVTAIAALPEEIRGYGHVKERHLKVAEEKRALLLQSMRAPAQAAKAA